jgi:predicted DsbA family dithiol-disulfide isomerase
MGIHSAPFLLPAVMIQRDASEPSQLEFYFDVLCPFAWRTSLWIREVMQQRPVSVTWKQFSLAIVNKADPAGEFARKDLTLGRLYIAAERLGGNAAVDRLYLALGDAIHGQGLDPLDEAVLADALTAAGLPAELRDAVLADESTEQEYRESHDHAVAMGGFGVPLLVFEGSESAYFGPVVEPVPTGEAALDLWDFTQWAAHQPYLWELKRDRNGRKLGPLRATISQDDYAPDADGRVDACAWVPAQKL